MQLLVSSEDVENYKQIKCDLDELRLLVEKSELWVYKGKGASTVSAQPPGLKKRKSKMTALEDKPDTRMESHGKLEVRESVTSAQVSIIYRISAYLSFPISLLYYLVVTFPTFS